MGQQRLNDLAMLFYHCGVDLSPKEVVEEFACRHS